MSKKFLPEALCVRTFAHAGAVLAVSDPLVQYPRLANECSTPPTDRLVVWSARGELRTSETRAEEVWLHLEAQAHVPLTCQRCLTPAEVPLQVTRAFRFVADEATAEAEDDGAEEDLLAISAAFDLRALVEDELLMELPLVPRHSVCPVAVPTQAGEGELVTEKPNPFAVLAGLQARKLN